MGRRIRVARVFRNRFCRHNRISRGRHNLGLGHVGMVGPVAEGQGNAYHSAKLFGAFSG